MMLNAWHTRDCGALYYKATGHFENINTAKTHAFMEFEKIEIDSSSQLSSRKTYALTNRYNAQYILLI